MQPLVSLLCAIPISLFILKKCYLFHLFFFGYNHWGQAQTVGSKTLVCARGCCAGKVGASLYHKLLQFHVQRFISKVYFAVDPQGGISK